MKSAAGRASRMLKLILITAGIIALLVLPGLPLRIATTPSNDGFIMVTWGSPGMGNGTVSFTVAPNPGPAIRSGTITVAGKTFIVRQGIDLLDVPTNDPFYNSEGKLVASGVTLGCGGGNYCPTQPVTRAQMAAFLVRAFNL